MHLHPDVSRRFRRHVLQDGDRLVEVAALDRELTVGDHYLHLIRPDIFSRFFHGRWLYSGVHVSETASTEWYGLHAKRGLYTLRLGHDRITKTAHVGRLFRFVFAIARLSRVWTSAQDERNKESKQAGESQIASQTSGHGNTFFTVSGGGSRSSRAISKKTWCVTE